MTSQVLPQVLEKGAATTPVLHLQETLGTLMFLGQFVEEVTHAFQSRIVVVKIEAQREVRVGGSQMQVDQVVDGGLHLGGIILTDLRAHSCWAVRN